MLGRSISSNSLFLGLFALITAAILAGTQLGTAERINKAERDAAQKALFEVVPEDRHNNDMLVDIQPIAKEYWAQLGLKTGGNIHIARYNGKAIAAIIPAVAPDGYSGDIKMIAGINADGTIAGIRVLQHNETPGLGDNVDLKKSNWILQFNGKSLVNPIANVWAVKKDGGEFDQFTGATITPRAVVGQTKRILDFFAKAQPLAEPALPEAAASH